jgi:hypothetical protein
MRQGIPIVTATVFMLLANAICGATPDVDQVDYANGVLFQRIWHRARAKLSNGLLVGQWQRGLPKL